MAKYKVYIDPPAFHEMKELPGNIRQRLRQAALALADNPRPPGSQALKADKPGWEVHRLRLEVWRLVYAVQDSEARVVVLGVRKRPPYRYGDLEELLKRL